MLRKLQVSNFKGFRSISIEPAKLNVIIGANGTGKTNFADLIDFLAVACRLGLKVALEKYGGLGEVRTKLPGAGRPPALACTVDIADEPYRGIDSLTYSFALSRAGEVGVHSENLRATVFARSPGRPGRDQKVKYDLSRKLSLSIMRERSNILEWEAGSLDNPQEFDDEENLILNAYGKLNPFQTVAEYIGSMRVFNIDAALAKVSHNGGDTELERDGSNLIPFLKRSIETEQLYEKFLEDLRSAVPYVDTISPERILSYTTLKFSERDSKLEFRAQQMSDGTIRLLGLVAVLQNSPPLPVVVIEEPENALHAYAIRTLVEIARRVSSADKFPTQVFFTSHSPAVVDELLTLESQRERAIQAFVTKRRDGANIMEPAPPEVIKAIANNLGRPSDFLREGSFEDGPQLELFDAPSETV